MLNYRLNRVEDCLQICFDFSKCLSEISKDQSPNFTKSQPFSTKIRNARAKEKFIVPLTSKPTKKRVPLISDETE